MSYEPTIIGTSTEERSAMRSADLERRLNALESSGGSQADGDSLSGTVSTTLVASSWTVDLGGPYADISVPEGGAFVQVYAEAEARLISGTSAARACVFDEALNLVSYVMQWPAAWTSWNRIRQPSTPPPDLVSKNGEPEVGSFLTAWQDAGIKRYSLRYGLTGPGSAEWRNRRLYVRVVR